MYCAFLVSFFKETCKHDFMKSCCSYRLFRPKRLCVYIRMYILYTRMFIPDCYSQFIYFFYLRRSIYISLTCDKKINDETELTRDNVFLCVVPVYRELGRSHVLV